MDEVLDFRGACRGTSPCRWDTNSTEVFRFVLWRLGFYMIFSWDALKQMVPDDKSWNLPLPPTCRQCGYNLTGLTSLRCPECGTSFKWNEVRIRTRRILGDMERMETVQRDVRQAWYLIGAGWAAGLLGALPAIVRMKGLLEVAALVLAFLSLVIALQISRYWRIPAWAREQMPRKPDMTSGVLAIGACVLLLGFSLAMLLI